MLLCMIYPKRKLKKFAGFDIFGDKKFAGFDILGGKKFAGFDIFIYNSLIIRNKHISLPRKT